MGWETRCDMLANRDGYWRRCPWQAFMCIGGGQFCELHFIVELRELVAALREMGLLDA